MKAESEKEQPIEAASDVAVVIGNEEDFEWSNDPTLENTRIEAIICSSCSTVLCAFGCPLSYLAYVAIQLPRYDVNGRHWSIKRARKYYSRSIKLSILGAILGFFALILYFAK